MAITRSTAAVRERKVVKTESGLKAATMLLISSGLVVFGLFLVFKAKTDGFDDISDKLKNKQMLNINLVENSSDLVPFLGVLSETDEKQFAAKRVYDYILGSDSKSAARRDISNIYELGRIRIDENEMKKEKQQLEIFR